ncbi:hypothetical protein ACJIZ3_023645 [Penstemon smallii]|uniref:Uncharacterized protein n=1 Tax=Penstemon smallii TaxID=265156 RepID=A0ABD3TPM4_9LAMI
MESVHQIAPHGSCKTIHLSAESIYSRQASPSWFTL